MRQEGVKVDDEFGPDPLCDPSFVPCREENCPRWETLHAEHKITAGVRGPRILDKCPRCQTPVVVTQTKLEGRRSPEIKAACPSCDWTFSNKVRNR